MGLRIDQSSFLDPRREIAELLNGAAGQMETNGRISGKATASTSDSSFMAFCSARSAESSQGIGWYDTLEAMTIAAFQAEANHTVSQHILAIASWPVNQDVGRGQSAYQRVIGSVTRGLWSLRYLLRPLRQQRRKWSMMQQRRAAALRPKRPVAVKGLAHGWGHLKRIGPLDCDSRSRECLRKDMLKQDDGRSTRGLTASWASG